MDGQSGRQSLVGTLDRGLAILVFLAERGECSVDETSDSLGLSCSTTYRLVDALRERGFVGSVFGSTKIGLGMKSAKLDLTRQRGYAVDNVENEQGVACVAAPAHDLRGFPIASISIAGQAEQVSAQRQKLGSLGQ